MSAVLDFAAPDDTKLGQKQPRYRRSWVRELLLVLAFYNVYQYARGSADVGARGQAFRNASWIIDIEKRTHMFIEPAVQRLAVTWDWLITFTNSYYGTVHFIGTIAVFVWVYLRYPNVYPRMRNLLGLTTGLGLICFWAFPLAPPRMFPCNDWVAAAGPQARLGDCVVDTVNRGGSPWSYKSGVGEAIANQFAAMPSLHYAWAVWCGVVIFTCSRSRVLRGAAVFHGLFTLFAVMATANHYLLDAVGGVVALLAAHWALTAIAQHRAGRIIHVDLAPRLA